MSGNRVVWGVCEVDLCLSWTSGGLWVQGQRQGHGLGQVCAGIQDPQKPLEDAPLCTLESRACELLCLRGQEEPERRPMEMRECCTSHWSAARGHRAPGLALMAPGLKHLSPQRLIQLQARNSLGQSAGRGDGLSSIASVRTWVRTSYNAPKVETTLRPWTRCVCVCIFSKRK